MRVRRSFFALAFVSFTFLSLLVIGIPSSGFANEPHVCINGAIATNGQNLGSTTQISWAFNGKCGHQSNTTVWKFYVYNAVTGAKICSDDNGGNGYTIPPDTELHTVLASAHCTGGTIPRGATVRLTARVWYQAVGTGWMSYDDNLTNN